MSNPSLPADRAELQVSKPPIRLRDLVLVVIASGTSAASLAAWIGSRWLWPCELACHFRVQYFWLLAACCIAYAIGRRFRLALLLGLLSAANLAVILPIYLPDKQAGEAAGSRLRVVSSNVLMSNRNYAALTSLLRETDPDIFALVEVDQNWLRELAPLETTYPYSHFALQGGRFGIALYSRKPWKTIDELTMGPHHAPVLRAWFDSPDLRCVVYCTHTMSPATRFQYALRNLEFVDLARMIAQEQGPVVLAGDLNSTGWSPLFCDMLTTARLKDSRQGFGVEASWPAQFMPLGVPIDHCLVSPEIQVLNRRVERSIGSDHYPILIDLKLPAGR